MLPNQLLHLSGAMAKVVIAVRLLEVQGRRRACARLLEDRLQVNAALARRNHDGQFRT